MTLTMMTRRRTLALLATAVAASVAASGFAVAQEASHTLTLRNGKFEPSTLTVKAGVKIKLTITNATAKSAEFESSELNREKVIPAGGSGSVYIGPLQPGSYPFFDDFNQLARGQIIAK